VNFLTADAEVSSRMAFILEASSGVGRVVKNHFHHPLLDGLLKGDFAALEKRRLH